MITFEQKVEVMCEDYINSPTKTNIEAWLLNNTTFLIWITLKFKLLITPAVRIAACWSSSHFLRAVRNNLF